MNRLIQEKSPYLLMHAHNPVDWYAWGEDAFEKARRENKPIFLSVGYSTCHWCHVMEKESFEDQGIAEIMNQHFVNIKVDREERPDVDRIYMAFVQATTGSGGWPMSVFLTPELKPFFGGTYWPPEDRYGRPRFRTVLLRVAQAWQENREKISDSAAEVTGYLQQAATASAVSGEVSEKLEEEAYRRFEKSYDPVYGGFGGAPKFPRPVVFNFLLRYYARTREQHALEMTLHSLRQMAAGGMHDHLGGGFHRYSVDAEWHVPHFEKMLYDQAQLANSYLDAFQITRDEFFGDVARDILDYVLRDLRSSEGGFYAAEDADSPVAGAEETHGEGAFYIWTAEEIEKILGREVAAIFDYCYGVGPSGNVLSQNDPQGELRGKNILHIRRGAAEAAQKFSKSQAEIEQLLSESRSLLLAERSRRPRPLRDDKILTSWNGLMISAFARGAQVVDEPRYLEAAEAAAEFIKARLYDAETGGLKRRYRAGEAKIEGFLDDYAFLIQGLLDLYEAAFDVSYLVWAVRLQEKQNELFWNQEQGVFFATSGNDPSVILRMRDDYDGAEPAGNSVAATNLLRLSQMAGRETWRDWAEKIFSALSAVLNGRPETMPQLMAALNFARSKTKQIVIAGKPGAADTKSLLRLINERYVPNKVVLLADGGAGQRQLAEWLPFVRTVVPLDGKATAYVCENYVCKLPSSDVAQIGSLLQPSF